MKKLILTLTALCLITGLYAQSTSNFPNGFNFQAILRSSTGDAINAKNINLKISITGDVLGSVILYSEIHTKTTSSLGAVSLVVGQGSPVAGTFAGIDWVNGTRYLKVEYKEATQSTFNLFSITQLMAVPFAIRAQSVEKEADPNYTNSAAAGITAADIARWNAASTQSTGTVPTGTVIYFAASTPPAGYLVCDGTAISRTQYPALLAVIGVTYGMGDGLNTFNLPDLRGEFIRGYDKGRGVDSARVFGSWQNHQFQNHKHRPMDAPIIQSMEMWGGENEIYAPCTGNVGVNNSSDTSIPTSGNHGSETRPRNIALLPCIKY